jgi:ribokinase
LRSTGIDTTYVRSIDGPTVHYRVTYATDGGRKYEWVGPEERLLLTSPEASDYAALAGSDWLHLAAMPIEAHEVGVAAGRAAGLPISLDPHEEYVIGFEDRLRAIAEGVVFMPSELEARLLFPDLDIAHPVEFGLAAAERLDAWGASMIAVKLGERGSVVRRGGRSVHVPARSTSVVDPTGAGDAFCGGFVVGWLITEEPSVAAACGTVAAAETIGSFGAFASARAPTMQERVTGVTEVLARIPGDRTAERGSAVAALRQHLADEPIATHP